MAEEVSGPCGQAAKIPVDRTRADSASTVCWWLFDSKAFHPFWDQYILCIVRLTHPRPDLPPPHLKFTGATHEMLVVAVNPDQHWTVGDLATSGLPPFLTPVNICEQYEATDAEMEEVAELVARAVVNGRLNLETGDAPELIRENWLAAVTKTLAHIRGEAHAS